MKAPPKPRQLHLMLPIVTEKSAQKEGGFLKKESQTHKNSNVDKHCARNTLIEELNKSGILKAK